MFRKFFGRKKSQSQASTKATPTGNVKYTVNYQIRASDGNKVIKTDSFNGRCSRSDVNDVIEQKAIKILYSLNDSLLYGHIFLEITNRLILREEKVSGTEETRYSILSNESFSGFTTPSFFDHR